MRLPIRRLGHRAARERAWADDTVPLLGIRGWAESRLTQMAFGGTPPVVHRRTLTHIGRSGGRVSVSTHRTPTVEQDRFRAALLTTLWHGAVPAIDLPDEQAWSELQLDVDGQFVTFLGWLHAPDRWVAYGLVDGTLCDLLCENVPPAAVVLEHLNPSEVPLTR